MTKAKGWTGALVALGIGVVIILGFQIFAPVDSGATEPVLIEIPSGSSVRQIAGILNRSGIISSPRIFVAYSMITGSSGRLQAGKYSLNQSMNIPEVLDALVEGRAETTDTTIVIPEGSNIWEVDRRLTEAKLIVEGEFARVYWKKEGYLFPDTYRFRPDARIEDIAKVIQENFDQKTDDVNPKTLIIASLLEKEAKTTEDMRLVAGVIQQRIKNGMLLQIDASVSYGACLRESLANVFKRDCDVTQIGVRREIEKDSEFNTYIHAGLPPRPISNPGLRAIEVAANPQPSDYLFYLSTRDGEQIIYSKTLEEHLANRREHLGF